MSRLALCLSSSLTLSGVLIAALGTSGCTGRDPADPGTDASTPRDAGVDAPLSPDASQGGTDAGSDAGSCDLDCPPIPEECHYEGRDCDEGLCGDIVCPDPDRLCGGLFHGFCPSTQYCDFTLDGACGTLDEIGYCRDRPVECPDDGEEVCGCDYNTYANACLARRAGRDVVMLGPCPPPDPCRGHDAWSDEGPCRDEHGWKWSGIRCEPIIGCDCVGSDCDAIYPDQDTCETESAECIAAQCDALDVAPIATKGCDEISLGWTWDGDSCEELVGCDCDGTECFRLEGTEEACIASWTGCGAGAR